MSLENKIAMEIEEFKSELKDITISDIISFNSESNNLLNSYRTKVNNLIFQETQGNISVDEFLKLTKPCSEAQLYLIEYFQNIFK